MQSPEGSGLSDSKPFECLTVDTLERTAMISQTIVNMFTARFVSNTFALVTGANVFTCCHKIDRNK